MRIKVTFGCDDSYIEGLDTIRGMDWLARHVLESTTVRVVTLVLKRLTQGFGKALWILEGSVNDTLRARDGSESLEVFPEDLLRVPL